MINPQYEGSWQQAKDVLEEEGFVLLANILDEQTHQQLLTEVQQRTYQEEHQPALHKYEQAMVPEQAHDILESVAKKLGQPNPHREELRKYQAGDYTLQDDDSEENSTHYTLFLTKNWDPDWRGEHTYAKENEQPLRVPPQSNALLVVKKDEKTRFFVKRVTHHAEKNEYYTVTGR